MAIKVNEVPEMRDVPVTPEFQVDLKRLEESLDRQVERLTREHRLGGNEAVHGTSMVNVGNALIFTLRANRLGPAMQFAVRQLYLAAGWDEVEFEPHPYEQETLVVLIEHKWPCSPRRLVHAGHNLPPLGPI